MKASGGAGSAGSLPAMADHEALEIAQDRPGDQEGDTFQREAVKLEEEFGDHEGDDEGRKLALHCHLQAEGLDQRIHGVSATRIRWLQYWSLSYLLLKAVVGAPRPGDDRP